VVTISTTRFYFWWLWGPTRARGYSFTRFLDHTQRSTKVGRNPLDEWSACRRELYLTKHNTHKRQTSMPRRDSKPEFLQASGRGPTPLTERPPGPASPGLTSINSPFCPHSVFMLFVWIWKQTAIISLYNINWLVFITETECVYCAVRTGPLYSFIEFKLGLK